MTDESSFLERIQANPQDLFLRLVYADWLEEREDARSEYLRVDGELQQLLGSLSPNNSRIGPKIRQLRARLKKLGKTLDPAWVAIFDVLRPTIYRCRACQKIISAKEAIDTHPVNYRKMKTTRYCRLCYEDAVRNQLTRGHNSFSIYSGFDQSCHGGEETTYKSACDCVTMTSNIPIYLFPGMTAEFPVFDRIAPLLPSSVVANYCDPLPNESLTSYAGRVAEQLPRGCFVAGVSFGGIVAMEVARIVWARTCFLIGSIRGPHQLPPWLRVWRLIGGKNCQRILEIVGGSAVMVPSGIRTALTVRLTKLSARSGAWHRWATAAVLDWRPSSDDTIPIIQIHGDADATFPIRYTTPDFVIPGGRHSLSVSHPREVAEAILGYIAQGHDEHEQS